MLDVKTGEQLTEEALEKWGNDLPTAILAYNDAFCNRCDTYVSRTRYKGS